MIDLNPFCAKDYDPRLQLHAPWCEDGKTVASDGSIIIVVDGIIGDAAEPLTISYKKIEKSAGQPNPKWLRLEELMREVQAPGLCERCRGTGSVEADPCDDCGGNGFFTFGQHDYDCKECGGQGFIEHSLGSADMPCPSCCGTKYKFKTHKIGDTLFQVKYLHMLSSLPGCELSVSDERSAIATFRFTGGRGWLMPCNA